MAWIFDGDWNHLLEVDDNIFFRDMHAYGKVMREPGVGNGKLRVTGCCAPAA